MKIKIVRIVLWSNTNTRQFQLKQLKRQKKGNKQVPKNQNQCINFKDSLQDHNIGLIFISTVLNTIL